VLTQRLRELADAGIVERSVLEPPASVTVYELTERGRALEPVLLELGRWGSETPRTGGREMSTASLLIALKTMFEPATDASVTYVLRIGAEAFTVAIADGSIEVRRGAEPRAAAELIADVTTLRMIVFLGTGVRAAEHAGALTIAGDRRAAARFPTYFRAPAVPVGGSVTSPAGSGPPPARRRR
jgi:hypothetical protein